MFTRLLESAEAWNPWRKAHDASLAVARPDLVTNALAKGENLYYFGMGSNMLRSKLESRGVDGEKIEILDMEPAVVPQYRLAFNMRGFLPLEPGMGSLEPLDSPSHPLVQYNQPECHGALVLLSAENYEKVMRSEVVSNNSTNAGYEEIIVQAYPYGSDEPVTAVALRARPRVRLPRDRAPSQRYLNILRQGAAELGLVDAYQDFLEQHPVHLVPGWLRRVAVHNFVFVMTCSTKLKTRLPSQIQSWFLSRLYSPLVGPRKAIGELLSVLVLLPGAMVGYVIRSQFDRASTVPLFFKRMIERMEIEEPRWTRQ